MSAQIDRWFQEMQDEIGKWARHNFPGTDRVLALSAPATACYFRLQAVRKQKQMIRGSFEEWDEEIRKEIGDILITLFMSADHIGSDLLSIFRDRWQDVRRRDFQGNPIGHGLPEE